MSKTIEQLRAEAALIEDAVRQGENTQVRVGGLFQDIIDFIAQIPITETVLGPLLQALNNSELINPGDGQTLTFSLMKEGWTFSDALTQLQIRLGQISSTVTSNYEAFLQAKNLLQAEVAATDERVRNYKTEYDQSQLEYATWKSQTDTSISQYAVAIDRNTRNIASISGRVDTAFDQLDFVTNDLDAAEKNLGKIFDLVGMNLSDEPSASWLYKNKDGIYGAAATFDASGNIKDLSTLDLTIKGFNTRVTNAEGQISQINQTVDSIQLAVAGGQQQINTINKAINGDAQNPGIIDRLTGAEGKITSYADAVSYIQQNRDSITATVGYFDEDGKLISTSGLVTRGDFSALFAENYNAEGIAEEVSAIKVSVGSIQQEVTRNKQASDAGFAQLSALINDGVEDLTEGLQNEINARTSADQSTATRITTVEGGLQAINVRLDKDGGIVAWNTFKTTVDQFTSRFDNVDGDYASLEQDVNGLKSTVGNQTGQISQITQNVSSISATVNDPNIGNSVLKQRADNLQIQVSSTDGRVTGLINLGLITEGNIQKTLATIKANILDFNFTDRWVVSSNGSPVMTLDPNGNLKIKGQLTQYATFGINEPIKVDGNGNIIRYDKYDNTWIPLFARRNVRILTVTYSGQSFTLTSSDDFVLVNPNSTTYVANVTLPSNVDSYGKVITIKQCGGKSVLKVGKSGDRISTDHATTQQDLNDYDRAELVYYSGTWFWNAMSI